MANGVEVDPTQCDMMCDGNRGEMCGGYDRLSAYALDALVGEINYLPKYVGCYEDRESERVMSTADVYNSSVMDNQVSCAMDEAYYSVRFSSREAAYRAASCATRCATCPS